MPDQAEVIGWERSDRLSLTILAVAAGVLEGWPRAAGSSALVRSGSGW